MASSPDLVFRRRYFLVSAFGSRGSHKRLGNPSSAQCVCHNFGRCQNFLALRWIYFLDSPRGLVEQVLLEGSQNLGNLYVLCVTPSQPLI